MKVKLLGVGAVGAPLAALISDHCDFSIILDEGRKTRYANDGQIVNGKKYFFNIADENLDTDTDLIILGCKNFHLEEAIKLIRPFVGPNTIILSLLNGVSSEKELAEHYKSENIFYGYFVGMSSVHIGNDTVCSGEWKVVYGQEDNVKSERILAIDNLFKTSGVLTLLPEDIHHEIWWKFLLNTCFNSLSAAMGLNYDMMLGNESLFTAVRLCANEVVQVAEKEGVILTDNDVEGVIAAMNRITGEGKTSMLQDMDAARKTENDYFTKYVSDLGKKHNIKTPYCDFVYSLVGAKEYAQSK